MMMAVVLIDGRLLNAMMMPSLDRLLLPVVRYFFLPIPSLPPEKRGRGNVYTVDPLYLDLVRDQEKRWRQRKSSVSIKELRN